MIRIPQGLAEDIENNFLKIGFCKTRTDFIRVSIVYKFSYISEIKELWNKAESYNNEVKDNIRNTVVDSILKGFKDKTIFETAKEVSRSFDKKDAQ